MNLARARPTAAPSCIVWTLAAFALLVAASVGCGDDIEDDAMPPAYIIGTHPAGREVFCGQLVNLVFNRDPGLVRSLAAEPHRKDQTGTSRWFRVSRRGDTPEFVWGNGESAAPFYVVCEHEPAVLERVTPDVFGSISADVLNAEGVTLHFNEPVTPVLEAFKLTDSAGVELRPTVRGGDDGTVIVLPPARGAFVPGETYRLTGRVEDPGGSETEIDLEFRVVEDDA